MSIYKMRTEFGKYLKPILFLIALIFLVGAIWSFGVAPTRRAGGEGPSGVIAKVNNVEIPAGDFEATWAQAVEGRKQQGGMISALGYADLKAQVLQQMIDDITLLQAAERMGVDVSESRVEAELDKIVTMELNAHREAVLGKLSRQRAKTDPRDDDDYKRELAGLGTSIAQQVEFAKSKYPLSQVKAQLARQGLAAKIKAGVEPVTEADITASYNVYKIRQIVLPAGSAPPEHLATKGKKIAREAASGADFAKLAKENMPGGGAAGTAFDYTFESSFSYPQQVKDAIENTKPGQVSPAIETPYGIYIIKVENVTSRLPAKLDKKAKDARRDQIRQMREYAAALDLQSQITKGQKVEVTDPEMLGYWHVFQAQRAANSIESKKQMKMAVAALTRARAERPNNYIASAKLAQLLFQDGKTEEAATILYPMLEGDKATQEGADLRMLLGDIMLKKGEKARATDQYQQASIVARADPGIHQQLIMKFQQLKRPDLVAAENKWMSDYTKRLEEMKKMGQRIPGRVPPGGGAPPAPAPPAPRE